jgi:protein-disulfide isomerase
VQSISAPDPSGLRTAKVLLEKGTQKQMGSFLITADGKEIVEGEKSALSADPWVETREHIDTRGAPAIGAADAPVTIVEYSDLECPFCRQEAQSIDQLMNEQPGKLRVIFKYFPLVEIHPWSMQAAEAAVCVADQDPSQFWNFEKAVFEAQDQINPANAAGRLRDFALESGAKPAPYAACLANPATKAKIDASIANGKSVGVVSTPTLFVDGRLIPGAIAEDQLKLLVDHESTFASSKIVGQQCGSCKVLPPIKH